MRKVLFLATIIIVLLFALTAIRFLFGGDEDTWICENNQWTKHGNPSAPMPTVNCNED